MATTIPGSVGTTTPVSNGTSNDSNIPSDVTATSSAPPEVTRKTLESTVERALALLRGIAGEKRIREVMHSHGYSDVHQQEGWRRLGIAAGFHQPRGSQDDNDTAVRNAINEIDGRDEQIFRIASATVTRRFPEQADKLLGGIGPGRGAAAVLNLEILLDRLDAFEQPSSSAQDKAAVALLGQRGLSTMERARLRQLINTAKKSNPVDSNPTAAEERDKHYVATLQALREWYEQWSEIARALFSRRDYLIRLGLGSARRSNGSEGETPGPAEPVANPAEPGV